METILANFLFVLRVNEIPNKTFTLDSHRPFICSEGVKSFINISWYFLYSTGNIQPDLFCYDGPLKRDKDFEKVLYTVLKSCKKYKNHKASHASTIPLSGDSNLAGWSPKYNVKPTFLV